MSTNSGDAPTVRINSAGASRPQHPSEPAQRSGPAWNAESGTEPATRVEGGYDYGEPGGFSPTVADTVGLPPVQGAGAPWSSQAPADTVLGARVGGPGMPVDRTVLIEPDRKPAIAWLVVANGPYAGHLYPLTGDKQILGREEAEIVLGDPSVSGRHAAIWSEENDDGDVGFVIQDLASSNGTWVNDEEVCRQPLKDRDRVTLGDTDLIFTQA